MKLIQFTKEGMAGAEFYFRQDAIIGISVVETFNEPQVHLWLAGRDAGVEVDGTRDEVIRKLSGEIVDL